MRKERKHYTAEEKVAILRGLSCLGRARTDPRRCRLPLTSQNLLLLLRMTPHSTRNGQFQPLQET
jgi:hypothetical protein